MAVLMIHDVPDSTLTEYDQVIGELESAGHRNPPGRISHTAGLSGTGYIVVDIWESEEAFQRFGQILLPLLEKAGGQVPAPRFYQVHNSIQGS